MAKIAFIQLYPYEALHGGDPEYVMKLACWLQSEGHEVNFLVSDMTRGRTKPWYVSPYPIDRFSSYRVRRAVRLGKAVMGTYPVALLNAASKLLRKGAKNTGHTGGYTMPVLPPDEIDWITRQVDALRPDVLVLCFDAISLARQLKSPERYAVALPSIIPGRTLSFNANSHDAMTASTEVPPAFLEAIAGADLATVTVEDDQRAIQKALPGLDVIVVRIGSTFAQHAAPERGPDVLFVGNETTANIDAIRWFLDEAWPHVLAEVPNARLRIAGRVARSLAAGGPGVDLVGQVPDLASEYARAQVVIAPVRQGTASLKTKVAEAISYGRAVVTTSIGVDPADPHQLDPAGFVADTAAAFADAIAKLLKDPALRTQKEQGAREVHAKYLSPQASYGALDERIASFLAAKKALSGTTQSDTMRPQHLSQLG